MYRAFTRVATGTLGLGLLAASIAPTDQAYAAAYKVLYQFKGGSNNDGSLPSASSSLIKDSLGNLYGTTEQGGNGVNEGTVFKVTATGAETVLHAFTGCSDFTDGCEPVSGLVMDSNGNLFGTTINGGSALAGTIFKVTTGGTEKILYTFSGGADGGIPAAGLVRDSSGNLFGTAEGGGSGGSGVVFKLSKGGAYAVLYSFSGGADGGTPAAKLMKDSSGNLYGTTFFGGATGNGVVFKLDTGGNESVLYSFQGGSDGANPHAGLVADSAGNLYGATEEGGNTNCSGGCGTVFKLAPGGAESLLYAFGGGSDGAYPRSDLIYTNGNLFGTATSDGDGTCLCGTIFKVTSAGGETTLHAFTGANDGRYPFGGLLKINKHLYGTASEGGDPQNDGVVFKVAR